MANEAVVLIDHWKGTLDTEHSSGTTTLDFTEHANSYAMRTLLSDEQYRLTFDPQGQAGKPEQVDLNVFSTGSPGTGTIARGKRGTTARVHPAGTTIIIAPIRDSLPRASRAKRTSGNITLSGTAWQNADTALDLALAAEVNDIVIAGATCQWSNQADNGFLDFVSLVSGSPVNAWGADAAESGTTQGIIGLYGPASTFPGVGASAMRRIASGDISSGVLTLRLRARQASAVSKVILCSADTPLHVWAINLGPEVRW